ncbi:MAG TPA: CehA/McbA family metallohydrolase [Candidatus Dormibacteraeota bacterium]|nr:CehA/McbA family metallohydrolase [Candidatus Dormibacteraeota bacterium]
MTTDPEYAPVPLDEAANAPLDVLPARTRLPAVGDLPLRGLPFAIEPDARRCLVHLGEGGTGEVEVTLGLAARHLVFAHRLLSTRIPEGDPPGRPVVDLVFTYEDGAQVAHTVRERFEVAAIPTAWGQLPFLALPDMPDQLPADRWRGDFGAIGYRQAEAGAAWAKWFYLWAWRNPRPDARVESLLVRAHGPAYVLGSIVAGFADEFPFPREGLRALRVTIDGEREDARLDWRVVVDRGLATFPHRLPGSTVEQFLSDPLAGFGDAVGAASSPAYVEVSAVPSATLSVRRDAGDLGSARWGDLLARGRVESGPVRIEVVEPGRNWVRVTVVDDETGRPLPCRVHFRSPEGVPFQPHGHHAQVNRGLGTWHSDVGGDLQLGSIAYAYIDGTCEGWLPRGDVLVDVARGFEYEPLRSTVRIEPGQRELSLRLRRMTDMNARRWFAGDTHVHFLSAQGAMREAQGEDVNVINLLLSQWGHLFTNTEEFTGEPLASADGRTIVWASQENRQHLLGHLTLLGLKRQVAPWCSDGPDEAELGGTLEVTLADWADRCHAQGGTVVIPHLPNPNGEPAALIATGRADAVEMLAHGSYQHLEYYRYLNGGYRLPLVGGTDKMTSDVPVGLYRTYVQVADEEFTYESWCRNLAAGRTFLSGGPLLSFSVEGAAIGDTLRIAGAAATVEVQAEVRSIFPVHCLQVVERGRVVAEARSPEGTRHLTLRERVRLEGHTWLAARTAGPDYTAVAHRDCWARGIMAHTSPIYVAAGGEWRLGDPATLQYMLTLVEGSLAYIRELSHQHAPGTVTHHHGGDHLPYLERPFLEAREALERRLGGGRA